MIKKINQATDINVGFPPFMSVINSDFHFARGASDGVYFQEIDEEKTLLFSLRGVTATICRITENADTEELSSFLKFQGVSNVLSDFFFQEIPLVERAALKVKPEHSELYDSIVISPSSRFSDYQNLFNLLTGNGDFENWFTLFSSKVNNSSAFGAYMTEAGAPVSCAIAPFVYETTAVVAGVYTKEAYRNKGYATRCVKTLLSELKKNSIEEVFLWCEDKNIKLYENIGFSQCGKIYVKKEE